MSAEADIFSDARFYAKIFAVHTCLLLVFCFCGDYILPEIRMNFFSFFTVALDSIIHLALFACKNKT